MAAGGGEEVIAQFAAAARRGVAAGFEVVEIYMAGISKSCVANIELKYTKASDFFGYAATPNKLSTNLACPIASLPANLLTYNLTKRPIRAVLSSPDVGDEANKAVNIYIDVQTPQAYKWPVVLV